MTAFPWTGAGTEGMSLRDYFAALAMQGLLSTGDEDTTTVGVAQAAYIVADAMLKAREA